LYVWTGEEENYRKSCAKRMREKRAERMLEDVEFPCAHYLVENKISWCPTHILSSVRTPIPLVVLPAKQK
jgi:hypothetical protein